MCIRDSSPGVHQTARADAVTGLAGVQSHFARDFDGDERFANGNGFGAIVQFTVAVPEPTSAVLLMGLGLVGVVRRRR